MEQEKQVILLIADISGYTRFMLNNAENKSIRHAQTVITALMTAVISEVKIPLCIAKLEGDSVFLYAAEKNRWSQDREAIRHRLPRLHYAFKKKLAELHSSNTCSCGACSHIEHLTIKYVVHAGKALFYKIGNLSELAGPDVIIVHRLLKNHIDANEYLLLTNAAYAALGYKDLDGFTESVEHYKDVGDVPVKVRKNLKEWQFQPDEAFFRRQHGIIGRIQGIGTRMMAMVRMRGKRFEHLE